MRLCARCQNCQVVNNSKHFYNSVFKSPIHQTFIHIYYRYINHRRFTFMPHTLPNPAAVRRAANACPETLYQRAVNQ